MRRVLSRSLDQVVLRMGQTVHAQPPWRTARRGSKVRRAPAMMPKILCQAGSGGVRQAWRHYSRMVEGFHPGWHGLRAIPTVIGNYFARLPAWRMSRTHRVSAPGGKREGRRIMAATWSSTKFCIGPGDAVRIREFRRRRR